MPLYTSKILHLRQRHMMQLLPKTVQNEVRKLAKKTDSKNSAPAALHLCQSSESGSPIKSSSTTQWTASRSVMTGSQRNRRCFPKSPQRDAFWQRVGALLFMIRIDMIRKAHLQKDHSRLMRSIAIEPITRSKLSNKRLARLVVSSTFPPHAETQNNQLLRS